MASSLFPPRNLTVRMSEGDSEKSAVSEPDAKAEMQMRKVSMTRLTMVVGSNPL